MARSWILGMLIFLVGNEVMGQWYTDPHNPVEVYPHVQVRGGLMPDLNGGAYFFIEGPDWSSMMSHVIVDGQWSCPLPGVIIGPPTSAFAHTEVLDPDNNLISHVSECDPTWPDIPSLLNKWSPNGTQVWQTFSFPDTLTKPSQMVSDNAGGCIILIRIEDGGQYRYYIQRFNASGQPQFGWTERPLVDNPRVLDMISDGIGGAFAVWTMASDSVYDVRMQHIRADGSFTFSDSGITLVESYYFLYGLHPSLAGSFILGWSRTQIEHHLSRFDSLGIIIWDRPAVECDRYLSDRLGGLYFFWESDTTYSRMNASGDFVFSAYSLPTWQFSFPGHIITSPIGEIATLFWDESNELWTLQKYDSLGVQIWENPVPILYGMPPGIYPYEEYLTADTRGGVILCFIRVSGSYFTRVDAFGNVGSGLYVNQPPLSIPTTFQISAYPNPFNNQINLIWSKTVGGTIWLDFTNLLGQRIQQVKLPSGATHYIWDGKDASGTLLPSGIYFTTLQIGQITQSLQITLIK